MQLFINHLVSIYDNSSLLIARKTLQFLIYSQKTISESLKTIRNLQIANP